LIAVGLDAGRVLIHRAVGRLDAEHLLAAEQERRADDVEDSPEPAPSRMFSGFTPWCLAISPTMLASG
jgi:hypothetical protein